MYYDKSKFEELIVNSPLFDIDRDEEESKYKSEALKMVENLYCYLMAINEKNYEPYGCEIMEVANRCIKNYDSSKGEFLHYFNAAWKQEYSHITAEKIVEEKYRNLKISEDEKRGVYKYLKLAEKLETSISESELYQRIGKAMDIPEEKVRFLAEMSEVFVESETIVYEDGEEGSSLDGVADEMSIEERVTMEDTVKDFLQKIDAVFDSLQERQKAIISDVLTARIWSEFDERQLICEPYHFISRDIVEEYERTGVIPTQREIAEKHNRDEASVSRTMKIFEIKLKQ